MELKIKKTETKQDSSVQVSETVTASVTSVTTDGEITTVDADFYTAEQDGSNTFVTTDGEITTVDADFYTAEQDGSNTFIGHINWSKGKVSMYGFELTEETTQMLNTFREIFTEVTVAQENIVN